MIQNCKILTVKLVKLSDPSDLWSEWSNIEGRESVALAITGKPMQRPSACVACRYSQGIMGWLLATSEFLVKIKFLSCGRATYYIYSQRRQMAMKYYEVPRLLHRLFKWSEDSSVGFQMYVLWSFVKGCCNCFAKMKFNLIVWCIVHISKWTDSEYVDDKIITSCLVHATIQRKGRHLQS